MTGGEYYRATVEAVRGQGNYFKATRPDGMSFADPIFAYVIGETSTAKGDGSTLCERGLLHFADTPSETLVGGSWPCRLFEVAPNAILASNGNKHGAKSLTVIRELPAWMALGPNGRAAAAFIDLLPTLVDAAWHAAAYAAARDAVWYAARSAACSASRDASRYAVWYASRDAARHASRDASRDAVWDAVSAIVTADLITPAQFQTLYRPFAKVLPIEKVREHGIAMWPMVTK